MTPEAADTVRVLFVEDAIDESLLVKTFFNSLPGFAVTHTQDGDRALELLKSQQWDMLVSDLNLPGTDGFSVIKTARAKYPDLPILAVTGYTQPEWEEKALRAGADQVMFKPLNQNDFVSRVWTMVGAGGGQPAPKSRFVLAVEGAVGDALMGCGGALMRAADQGHQVVIVPMYRDEREVDSDELKAARVSCELAGLEMRADKTLFGDMIGQKDLLHRIVNELRPVMVYMPASNDAHPSRSEAHDITRAATAEVKSRLGYETATTNLYFRPSQFVDVSEQMALKLEALAAYETSGAQRPDLDPRLAEACARYWGKHDNLSRVEAFELIKGG